MTAATKTPVQGRGRCSTRREAGRAVDTELHPHVRGHCGRHVGRVGEEGVQKTDFGKLDSESQAVVIGAAPFDQTSVGIV